MKIIGHDRECKIIEFNVRSTTARFKNITRDDIYMGFDPDAVFIFNDTREIDNLIHMLEEVKRENDGFLGIFERVYL